MVLFVCVVGWFWFLGFFLPFLYREEKLQNLFTTMPRVFQNEGGANEFRKVLRIDEGECWDRKI